MITTLHLYRILLLRDSDSAEQYGIVQATSHFEAERAALEAAKAWESQGYRLYCINHEERRDFDNCRVHWL